MYNSKKASGRNAYRADSVDAFFEEVAASLGADAERVFEALTKKSDILYGYIVPEYEVLHTQSKDYIVNEIKDVMRERGVVV